MHSKKIKSSFKSLLRYLNITSLAGIVKTFPFLSIAWIDTSTSLNSLLKHPAFIFSPPPMVPGMHDKNSNPPIPLFSAKSESFLSRHALPAIKTSFGNIEILEKFFLT